MTVLKGAGLEAEVQEEDHTGVEVLEAVKVRGQLMGN
jgi:hypothetical protein